ncbi:MAG: hypothetical protein MK010_03900 [Erythrobacter sp.]|nr:hypothetical protein [Erythrobacter sp.]
MLYEDRTFENETITLDDNEFVRCVFRGCVCLYAGGPYRIQDTQIDKSRLEMEGAAKNGQDCFIGFLTGAAESAPAGAIFEINGRRFQLVE